MTPEHTCVAILCGGLGTRLGPLTAALPKPLMPVLGRPFLEHQVELLARQGFRRFVLLTGYLGDLIEEHFRDLRPTELEFSFSRESSPLGTGGAVAAARGQLGEVFLLLNGDSYLEIDYVALLAKLLAAPGGVAGVLAAYRNPVETAGVEGNNLSIEGDKVLAYLKRGKSSSLSHVDAGAGAYRDSLFRFFLENDASPVSLEEKVWPRAISLGALVAFPTPERPWDIGTPERLEAFEARLFREESTR